MNTSSPLGIPLHIMATTIIKAVPLVLGLLDEDTKAAIKAAGYDGIRTVMSADIFGAIFAYLSGGSLSDASSRMSAAVAKAYIETADAAYVEGGSELPLDDETAAYVREQVDAQFAFIDQLFADLKDLRKEGDFDAGEIARARADGYASSLDQLWSEVKTRAAANKMLTFVGDDGKESCKDCKRMKGERHKASWWISHDMVPGSSNYECGGWNCEHFLEDDQGNRFTI